MRRMPAVVIGSTFALLLGSLTATGAAAPASAATKHANAIAVSSAQSRIVRPSTAWTKVTLKIKNTGKKSAKKVKVSIAASKGARVKTKKYVVSSIKPGTTKKITIAIKRVSATGTVKVAAKSAAGAKSTYRIALVSPDKQPPPQPTVNELVGDGFWSYFYDPYSSEDGYSQLYFVDDNLAYWGVSDRGVPGCTAATITSLGDVDGCIAYTFDPVGRTVAIGGKTAAINAQGGLAFDAASGGDVFELLVYPEAGTALDVSLEHIGYSGCAGLPYCSTWTNELAMNGAGQFVRTESSVTTIDVPGGPFTAAGNYPPDSYGTYAIVARGLVELRFADGHVESLTLAYEVGPGGAAPATEGLFLGADYYWVPTD